MILLSSNLEKLRFQYTLAIKKNIIKLQNSYDDIKTLKGLVPVCSSCKAIRNDKGYWTKLEIYMEKNSELVFSHGVCDKCLKREVPKIYNEMLSEGLVGTVNT